MSVNLQSRLPNHSYDGSSLITSEDDSESLLILTINIGDGRTDIIHFNEGDDPSVLSKDFCQKHNLKPKVQIALRQELERHIANQELRSSSSNIVSRTISPILIPSSSQPPNARKRKLSVHERLFSLTKNLVMKPCKSAVIPKKKITPEAAQRLYFQGVTKKELLKKQQETIRNKRTEDEVKEATFKPVINKRNTQSRYHLLEKWDEHFVKLERARKDQIKSEIAHCTFSPGIDRKSSRIALKRSKEGERFTSLYNNAQETRTKVLSKSNKM